MSKSITKLLVCLGIILCLSGFFETTIARSQTDSSNSCLTKSSSTPLIDFKKINGTVDKVPKEFLDDASMANEKCEQSENLTSITKANPQLIWRTKDGKDQVLMVTWQKGYLASLKPDESYTVKGNYSVWVTAVPEVKEFILHQDQLAKSNQTDLIHRIEQYLGLKPNSKRTNFVEVWVNQEDLIRPCLKSKVTVNDPKCADDTPHPDKNGYPFTGLGYTYDWGNPKTDVGASEFTVKSGKIIIVDTNKTTDEYLQGLTPRLQQQK
jgi:hypothetical protein